MLWLVWLLLLVDCAGPDVCVHVGRVNLVRCHGGVFRVPFLSSSGSGGIVGGIGGSGYMDRCTMSAF
eukprot:5753506-Prorocentrum_lima.AAC.1